MLQAYAAWDDGKVCDPEAANAVAGQIKTLLRQALGDRPNVKHIVVIGNDEMTPFLRLPDITETGNEREYALQALVNTNTALYSALSAGIHVLRRLLR